MAKKKNAISPTREENYPEWYQEVIKEGDLAENSPVRGCMVIKPWGYALWENIVKKLDARFKEVGVENAYFPIFIPLELMQKEAEHIEGFAKECAVVTHHRLTKKDGKLVPDGKLAEPLIVRPTSETIIGESFAKWVSSYRDLPILLNQWCNIVRWEMRTRLFLRTSEFLWQEGHTVHQTRDEAFSFTETILNIYADVVEEELAIPVIRGKKSPMERFPGAVETMCIEAMMQDGKALQAGTSHFLGQNFAKGSNIKFQSQEGKEEFAWTTSWGASTRLIGGLIMTHSDDDGLIIPPKIAPKQVVLLPIIKDEANEQKILDHVYSIKKEIESKEFNNNKISVEIDNKEQGGIRVWRWIKKGIPIRIEIGIKELENDTLFVGRRDNGEKKSVKRDEFVNNISNILDEMQKNIFSNALKYRNDNIFEIDENEEFYEFFKSEDKKGFTLSPWCGSIECEKKIQEDLSVTIRCVPFNDKTDRGKCICCGKESTTKVFFAKSY